MRAQKSVPFLCCNWKRCVEAFNQSVFVVWKNGRYTITKRELNKKLFAVEWNINEETKGKKDVIMAKS